MTVEELIQQLIEVMSCLKIQNELLDTQCTLMKRILTQITELSEVEALADLPKGGDHHKQLIERLRNVLN